MLQCNKEKPMASAPRIIKKYGNRRLYDTGDSRYVTLDEVLAMVQSGIDIQVVDAKDASDLTQATLVQIIIDERNLAGLLPVPLLHQLIRLGDDALAEFLGHYMTGALQLYLQAKRNAQAVASYTPLAQLPFAATDALARMWMASPFAQTASPPAVDVDVNVCDDDDSDEEDPETRDEVAALRRELEELKRTMRGEGSGSKSEARRRKEKGAP